MPDLVLINPRSGSEIYGSLGDMVACEPPLWCRLIAGYVRDRGYSVEIIDAAAEDLTPQQVAQRAADVDPSLICIVAHGHQPSASTQSMVGVRAIAELLQLGELPVIVTGGHVTALPVRTMNEECVDYACRGEGPETIVGLLRGDPLERIPGLVWRGMDLEVIVNTPALLLDMGDLHGRAWDLLPMERYRAHNWQCLDGSPRQPYASAMTSLGCPFSCSFCCINAPFESNRYRMRNPDAVVEEITKLYRADGVRTFKIVDEMFVLNERHYSAICERLASTIGGDINVWAYARVDTVKPERLALLRAAGIRWLALGIESGSEHVRDGAEKHLRTDDIVGTVRAIQAAGINVIGNYIFGLPDDTAETMRATLDLAKECRTEFANFYGAMAYPGSALYQSNGRAEDWAAYAQHGSRTRPMGTATLSPEEVTAFRDRAFIEYFTDRAYEELVAGRFGVGALGRIRQMLERPLTREATLAR